MDGDFGNAFALTRLTATSAQELAKSHGNAFLVIQGRTPLPRTLDDDTSNVDISMTPGAPPEPKRGHVYLVARKPSSTFEWVAVGRHENNDVFMPHASVSRFHALIREERGETVVYDAKSNNGTFVANARARAHGTGEGTIVRPGMEIRFGEIVTMFLDAAGLFQLTRIRSRGPFPGVG